MTAVFPEVDWDYDLVTPGVNKDDEGYSIDPTSGGRGVSSLNDKSS